MVADVQWGTAGVLALVLAVGLFVLWWSRRA
jgi:hypothetical protein